MKVVIQRVSRASILVDANAVAQIGPGLLLLVGIEDEDGEQDLQWLAKKIVDLRIFNDDQNLMNRSIREIDGDLLVVSQFTLHASTKKGRRPSFIRAAKPSIAEPIFSRFVKILTERMMKPVQTGIFGANMQIELTNDGPVTIIINTKNRE